MGGKGLVYQRGWRQADLASVQASTADTKTMLPAEATQSQALQDLLGPEPAPVPLEELANFLCDNGNRKLPVSGSVYEELVTADSVFEGLLRRAAGPVAAYMAGLIHNVRG